jgi:hypothetical protein
MVIEFLSNLAKSLIELSWTFKSTEKLPQLSRPLINWDI